GPGGGGGAVVPCDVSLVLRAAPPRPAFSFRGEVAEGRDASDEEGRSRTFVRLLTATIGVGLGPGSRRG
ncbi:MAG: hypothetical protein AAGA54_36890, partial [Myxococcota bacterium]